MTTPLALWRRKKRQAGPAQAADDSCLEACEQPVTRDAAAGEKQVEGAPEILTDDTLSPTSGYSGGGGFASRLGSIYRSD